MRTLVTKTLYILICAALLSSCVGPPWVPMDADADMGQPEYDVTGLVEEWEGPVGINVFSRDALFVSLYTGTDNILLSDFNGGIIFMLQPGQRNVWAQRISSEGERLWMQVGIPVTAGDAYEWMGREGGLERGGIPDREGGAYVLYNRPHIDNEIFIMGNHIFPDGSLLYPSPIFEHAIHGPHDPIKRKFMSSSVILEARLLLNIWLFDGDYLSANGLNNICPVLVDELFENPTPELHCLGMGGWGVPMLQISDSEAMYMTSHITSLVPGDPYFPVRSVQDDKYRYNIINSDIQSVTGGEIEVAPPLEWDLIIILNGLDIEYDRPAGGIFFSREKVNPPIIKLQLMDHVLTYSWKMEDDIGTEVGVLYSIRGDGTGGLYVAGMMEGRDEDCPEIECCSREIDRCDTQLRIQLYDHDGFPVYPIEESIVEIYRRINAPRPGQYAYWDPAPIFSRSIDHEPDGNAIYFWRKPLVHEGAQYPDTYSYDLGYVICAQKATPESPAAWGDGKCVPVAQIFMEDSDYYGWYDAVDDGQGGSIILYNDYTPGDEFYHTSAQRISSSGQLLWNDTDGP
jgi:hypothetical protein